MLITWHGHSEFYLEGEGGFALLTDPYDAHVGYPMGEYRADAVCVSHGHGDHNFTEKAKGNPVIVSEAGVWQAAPDVKITAIPSFHDAEQGAKRGSNLIMKIEMEGLSLCHLGDLGAPLNEDQIRAIGHTDILMTPVGDYYTIDAHAARQAVYALRPRIVIPMHFKDAQINGDWPISDGRDFLSLMGEEKAVPMPLLRVTREDLSQQPLLALLSWQK